MPLRKKTLPEKGQDKKGWGYLFKKNNQKIKGKLENAAQKGNMSR